jgi:hypothetical protein
MPVPINMLNLSLMSSLLTLPLLIPQSLKKVLSVKRLNLKRKMLKIRIKERTKNK